MITFPNCKINLGLNILNRRDDGFHNLETVFYPIPFNDVLEIVTSHKKTEFTNTGISGGENADNLCMKAFYLVKSDFPELPEIKMHLHKTIPVGAGLGGGSADATFTLLLLNKKYGLNISNRQLLVYASQLGSDCPFFLVNAPCFATSTGDKMEKTELDLSSYKILLINPAIHISTKELFRQITPAIPEKSIRKIIKQPIDSWKYDLRNDFEPIIFSKYREIKELKEFLYSENAIYASMSGTGSTVFGIFEKSRKEDFAIGSKYFHKWIYPQVEADKFK